jgi:hypothetical protein
MNQGLSLIFKKSTVASISDKVTEYFGVVFFCEVHTAFCVILQPCGIEGLDRRWHQFRTSLAPKILSTSWPRRSRASENKWDCHICINPI